ncbi:MAG TPA: amino acid permease [Longimicrobiales bacterium]|nr:amino acid permease [Longimicrobiales bacterium]
MPPPPDGTGVDAGATLREQVEGREHIRTYGTFAGVFTPTLLTILGVIMYLRQGSVVGNAGLGGAWLIIGLVCGIIACTAMSMSSITTNIRIGAGGAYSIISQSLGLEVGGSVGVPLYLSQALAVTMYIFGFREGWQFIFPDHPALAVDLLTFAVILGIALVSAGFAFRIQYLILAVIVISLISVFGTAFTGGLQYEPQMWGDFQGFPESGFQGTDVWFLFALFFPAATGIMAGANMSGELEDPRRSIPLGTLAAVAVGTVVYMALAWWLARAATPQELVENYTIMIDRALWGPAVLAGLLGATFSSGLASLVGAPRILQALADSGVVLGADRLAERTSRGEPRNAVIFTGVVVLFALFLRDLNTVAPLITMFFLITYAMINVVVFIEQSLGLISFRPLYRIPQVVPFIGAAGCLFAMFIIEPVFGLVAVGLVVGFYMLLLRRRIQAPGGDVRSGLFVALAEWAAQKVTELPPSPERSWRPSILVPVERMTQLRGGFPLLADLTSLGGSVKLLGLEESDEGSELRREIPAFARAFRKRGVFAQTTFIREAEPGQGLVAAMQALDGAFFRPNCVFTRLPLDADPVSEQQIIRVNRRAQRLGMGVIIFADHPEARLGRRQSINVWMRDQSPDWKIGMRLGNMDMSLLLGYILREAWSGDLRVVCVVEDEAERENARRFVERVTDLARIPDVDIVIRVGTLHEQVPRVPTADLDIFGLSGEPNFDFARHVLETTASSCLFVRDSGQENALA